MGDDVSNDMTLGDGERSRLLLLKWQSQSITGVCLHCFPSAIGKGH